MIHHKLMGVVLFVYALVKSTALLNTRTLARGSLRSPTPSASMEAAAIDAARMAVATGTAVTDPPIAPESDAHSRSVMDDIVEISLLPTPSSFAGSPQSPPQARRSLRRASRTTRSSYAGSIVGESQGATQTRPDLPASQQDRTRTRGYHKSNSLRPNSGATFNI